MATTKKIETNPEVSSETSVLNRESDRKKLLKHFSGEAKVQVIVSPFYKPYLGSTVMVSIQGITVWVPADGRTYKIPKSFAAELLGAIAAVDSRVQKIQRMSNVAQNFETSVGELRF